MFSFQRPTERRVTDRHPRRSFTLVELLMVVVIIGVLMSLAFAAFSSVMTRARVAEVKGEIDGMSSALSDFKAKFGFFPPSFIRLHFNGYNWNNDPRSRAIIRRMFPQFDFIGNPTANPPIRPGGGPWPDTQILTGAECLVFFLGGIQDIDGVPTGFSNSPFRPFSLAGTNRLEPMFDFDAGRVSTSDVDGDGMREYVSPLASQTTPYLYMSAYDSRGYASPRSISKVDLDVFTALSDPNPDNMSSVYLQGKTPWKPRSFQIICPGFDDLYGQGGVFDANNPETSFNAIARDAERDNITSFHSGMLAP